MFVGEIFGEESLESIDDETLNIIRTFFENNLNLSETSRQLYVHRNTLVYRFEKLQKRFGLDIRTFEDALAFKLAMMVSDYITYSGNHGKQILLVKIHQKCRNTKNPRKQQIMSVSGGSLFQQHQMLRWKIQIFRKIFIRILRKAVFGTHPP